MRKKSKDVNKAVEKYKSFYDYLIAKGIKRYTARTYCSYLDDDKRHTVYASSALNHYALFLKDEEAKNQNLFLLTTKKDHDSESESDSEFDEEFPYDCPKTQQLADSIHSILALDLEFQKKIEILNLVIMGYIK